jgi:hypothetical protein
VYDWLLRLEGLPRPPGYNRHLAQSRSLRLHLRGIWDDNDDSSQTLLRRHPREDATSFEWRKANFVPITLPLARRALARVQALLHDTTYELRTSAALEAVLNRPVFGGVDFFSFVQSRLVPAMLEDANAVLHWCPQPADPLAARSLPFTPVVVPSSTIRYHTSDLLIYEQPEPDTPATRLAWPWQPPERTLVFQAAGECWQVRARCTQGRWEALAPPHWLGNHPLHRLPAVVLGGIAQPDGTGWASFWDGFVPFADEALRQFSDWQVVLADSAYPIKEISPLLCTAEGCSHGWVTDDRGRHHPCTACNGTGYVLHTGPFAALVRPAGSSLSPVPTDSRPLVSYITPPTEILRYAQQAWQVLLDQAADALHLRYIEDAQSGTAKRIDREHLYAHLTAIATNVFDRLMLQSLEILEGYVQPTAFEQPWVEKPGRFDLHADTGLGEQLEHALRLGQPHLAHLTACRWLNQHYAAHSLPLRWQQALARFDPLCYTEPDQRLRWLEAGIVSRDVYRKSLVAPQAIARLTQRHATDSPSDLTPARLDALLAAEVQDLLAANA